MAHERHVVVANDGNVLRAGEANLGQGFDGADGHDVVGGEYAVGGGSRDSSSRRISRRPSASVVAAGKIRQRHILDVLVGQARDGKPSRLRTNGSISAGPGSSAITRCPSSRRWEAAREPPETLSWRTLGKRSPERPRSARTIGTPDLASVRRSGASPLRTAVVTMASTRRPTKWRRMGSRRALLSPVSATSGRNPWLSKTLAIPRDQRSGERVCEVRYDDPHRLRLAALRARTRSCPARIRAVRLRPAPALRCPN